MTPKFTAVAEEAFRKTIDDLCNQIMYAEAVFLDSTEQELLTVFIGPARSGQWIEQKVPGFKNLIQQEDPADPQIRKLKKITRKLIRRISYARIVFLNSAQEPLFYVHTGRVVSGDKIIQQVPICGSVEITLF